MSRLFSSYNAQGKHFSWKLWECLRHTVPLLFRHTSVRTVRRNTVSIAICLFMKRCIRVLDVSFDSRLSYVDGSAYLNKNDEEILLWWWLTVFEAEILLYILSRFDATVCRTKCVLSVTGKTMKDKESKKLHFWAIVFVFLIAVLFRWATSCGPYSGMCDFCDDRYCGMPVWFFLWQVRRSRRCLEIMKRKDTGWKSRMPYRSKTGK